MTWLTPRARTREGSTGCEGACASEKRTGRAREALRGWMMVLEKIRHMLAKKSEKNVALLVDGPNMIRKDMNVDLMDVKRKVEKHGRVKVCKIFLDQYASDKLIEA